MHYKRLQVVNMFVICNSHYLIFLSNLFLVMLKAKYINPSQLKAAALFKRDSKEN